MRARGGSYGVATFLAVLLLAPTAGADWLQAGGHAARTGAAPSAAGPRFDDLAYTLQLAGRRAVHADPIIVGRDAYVVTAPGPAGNESALWRIDLDDARPERLLELAWWWPERGPTSSPRDAVDAQSAFAAASDGARIYVAGPKDLLAWDVGAGAVAWAAPLPRAPGIPASWHARYQRCDMAVADVVVVACVESIHLRPALAPAAGHDGSGGVDRAFVAVFEKGHGALRWVWREDQAQSAVAGDILPELTVDPSRPRAFPQDPIGFTRVSGLALVGPRVIVATAATEGSGGAGNNYYWSLALEDGRPEWVLHGEPDTRYPDALANARLPMYYPSPAGDDASAYIKVDNELRAITPATGSAFWAESTTGRDARDHNNFGGGFGLAPDAVFATLVQTLAAYDRANHELLWTPLVLADDEEWAPAPLVVAGDMLYARSQDYHRRPANVTLPDGSRVEMLSNDIERTRSWIHAIDARDGSVLWRRELVAAQPFNRSLGGNDLHRFGVSGGVLVAAGLDGTVTVLGRTAASLQPSARASTLAPAPGELVRVDLSGTRDGIGGPPSAYRAEWGDGTVSDWQASPMFEHAYLAPGELEARFRVRNDAGQGATELVRFRVGGASDAPAREAPPSGGGRTAPDETLEASTSREDDATDAGSSPFASQQALVALGGAALVLLVVLALLVLWLVLRTPRRAPPVAQPLAPGVVVLGKYRIEALLGEGGQGATWLATDTLTRRRVAIKVVPKRAGRALKEARAAAAVRHPNVVLLYEVEPWGDVYLLVMEYAEGGTLSQHLRSGPLDDAAFARVADGLLAALDALHAAGAVHRDVKPSNVLLAADGEPKLADFGIASLPSVEPTLGTLDATAGTLRYMSPEQARGRRVTAQSDLYSAAVTLYEAATGIPYFAAREDESAYELRARVADAPRFENVDGIDERLAPWFARALEPSPAARFASAREMRAALRAALERERARVTLVPR